VASKNVKTTVSLDDILAALQGIATVQTDLAARIAAIESAALSRLRPLRVSRLLTRPRLRSAPRAARMPRIPPLRRRPAR
jgi:hypothetical protein